MKDQGRGGSIVSISSISALIGGSQQTAYTPTKTGIKSLMQSLAIALGPYNIRCNSLLPRAILTDINRYQFQPDSEHLDYFEKRISLSRIGVSEDIGGIAAFLSSDSCGYITGAEILIDSGLFVNLY